MEKLSGTFSQLISSKILVIGDLILDSYTIGKAKRISPEAPVPVLEVIKEEERAGGAGNVALNLASLSADVVLVGRMGNDRGGESLKKSLKDEGILSLGLFVEESYKTPVKIRVIADNQQLLRIDHEEIIPISKKLEQEIIAVLPSLLEGVALVAISDYGKGFLSPSLLQAVIALAKQRKIPVVADPKGIHFEKYKGVSILKPNVAEAYAAANMLRDTPIEEVSLKLLQITEAETLMITRAEAGISLFHRNGTVEHFAVRPHEVKDVTGAGDTVLAMLVVALASGLGLASAAKLCNVAAGIAIERFGCARVSLSDLARRLLKLDFTNKVFDEEHLFALQEALKKRKTNLLALSGSQGLTTAIFRAIKQLSDASADLIIYCVQADEEFINFLASMQNVHFIILNTLSLRNLCNKIEIDEISLLNGEELQKFGSSTDLLLNLETK